MRLFAVSIPDENSEDRYAVHTLFVFRGTCLNSVTEHIFEDMPPSVAEERRDMHFPSFRAGRKLQSFNGKCQSISVLLFWNDVKARQEGGCRRYVEGWELSGNLSRSVGEKSVPGNQVSIHPPLKRKKGKSSAQFDGGFAFLDSPTKRSQLHAARCLIDRCLHPHSRMQTFQWNQYKCRAILRPPFGPVSWSCRNRAESLLWNEGKSDLE